MEVFFNVPYVPATAFYYIKDVIENKHTSGNGMYTKKCQAFFEQTYGVKKALLTTSCTDALEMCALLLNLEPGDEVIMPSFTFVSTANAFILHGAKVVFADSLPHHPNMDPASIRQLITPKTKAIVVVHYAGVACDMDEIMAIAEEHDLKVIEDAAQGIDSTYKGKYLGTIGHLGTYSFHETKNIQCGEGGALLINDPQYIDRAEILWEKGTNRNAFFRGEVQKYNWVDLGSSFLPSDITSALLFAQLEESQTVQASRMDHWQQYHEALQGQTFFKTPQIPEKDVTHNAHIYYILLKNKVERDDLLSFLKEKGINTVFHYLPLHLSPYYLIENDEKCLPNSEYYADAILRLPLFYELKEDEIDYICETILSYFN